MWKTIKRIDNSKFNFKSKLLIFDLNENEESFVVLTRKVLQYINEKSLKVGDEIFIILSKDKNNLQGRYLLKNARRK